MESVIFTCNCGQQIDVSYRDFSREITCPACGTATQLTPDIIAATQNRLNRDMADDVSNESIMKTLKAAVREQKKSNPDHE